MATPKLYENVVQYFPPNCVIDFLSHSTPIFSPVCDEWIKSNQ
jgi:hypothetical protein